MEVVRNWLVKGLIVILVGTAPVVCGGAGLPDSITLDSLAKLYEGVPFNHAKHISLTKDCGVCHHHTTGTLVDDPNCVRCHRNSSATTTVACKDCHAKEPFSAAYLGEKKQNNKLYHLDKPGLKGAYHQSCMGCHDRTGGPTGCPSCHQRTKEGNAFYNTGEFAPKKTAGKTTHH